MPDPTILDFPISFINLLLLICISGFFGGFVSSIFDFLSFFKFNEQAFTKHPPGEKPPPIERHIPYSFFQSCGFCLGRSLVGVAGALGASLLGSWIGEMTIIKSIQDAIHLVGLCVIAGILSPRYLLTIGSKLAKQILMIEAKADIAKDKADTALSSVQEASSQCELLLDFSSDMVFAEAALQPGRKDDIPSAIVKLEEWSNIYPLQRTLHIFLGRLNGKLLQYDNAIKTLRHFIKAKTAGLLEDQLSPEEKEDVAVAYFNIACYQSMKAEKDISTLSVDEMNTILQEALSSLKTSIHLDINNRNYIKDEDLNFLEQKKPYEFKEL